MKDVDVISEIVIERARDRVASYFVDPDNILEAESKDGMNG